MEWNVYIENFNRKCIEVINLLKPNGYLWNACKRARKKYPEDKEQFGTEIRKDLMYQYWSRCEYEIVLTSWPPCRQGFSDYKIDVYDQVMLNWPVFLDYIWENRKAFK